MGVKSRVSITTPKEINSPQKLVYKHKVDNSWKVWALTETRCYDYTMPKWARIYANYKTLDRDSLGNLRILLKCELIYYINSICQAHIYLQFELRNSCVFKAVNS